jgi:CRISPR system Cascade subunit CasD
MPTLILNLVGAQSWGSSSYFKRRDTGTEPSKSGVYGLIEAAMGLQRSEIYPQLDDLRFGVRVDRSGHLEVDFQTAESVATANGQGHKNEVIWKSGLADAHFMVALEGERTILETIQSVLLAPKRPIYLGRRAFSPISPVVLPDSLQSESLEAALAAYPWCACHLFSWNFRATEEPLRVVIDDPSGYEIRHDVRVGSPALHEFTRRGVRTYWVEPVLVNSVATLNVQSSEIEPKLASTQMRIISEKISQRTHRPLKPLQSPPELYESQIIFEKPVFDPDDLNIIHNIVLNVLDLKGSQQKLPLLFRLEKWEKDAFRLIVRCSQQPDWSRIDQFDVVEVVSRPFQSPNLAIEDRFRFEILVNPTKKRAGKKFGLNEPEEQIDWFQKKAAQRGGFRILEIIRHLQKRQLVKRDNRRVFFTGAIFEGVGEVADVALFEQSLWNGLASSGKFAGFNMLQILEYPI